MILWPPVSISVCPQVLAAANALLQLSSTEKLSIFDGVNEAKKPRLSESHDLESTQTVLGSPRKHKPAVSMKCNDAAIQHTNSTGQRIVYDHLQINL